MCGDIPETPSSWIAPASHDRTAVIAAPLCRLWMAEETGPRHEVALT